MASRHAEIAGAGLAGLTVATALAQTGWTVRVHEKGAELREIGAGIYLWENALRALEAIGAYREVVATGEEIQAPQLRDHRNRVIQEEWLADSRLFTVARRSLHQVLVDTARNSGVEIITGSAVNGATPLGELELANGEVLKGDLVIGADGVHSKVRTSLGLERARTDLRDGCGRHMIRRTADDPVGTTVEQWSGGRRIGVVPCHPDWTYIFLCCPVSDAEGADQQPFSRDTWIESFPHFRSQLERIPDVPEGRFATFEDVRTWAWHRGLAAILGDAAHAMSPNLGQAACVAMMNGVALSQALVGRDVRDGLRRWQHSERPVIQRVQKYSRLYGRVGTRWPGATPALDARSMLIRSLSEIRPLQRRLQYAASYFPSIEPGTTYSSEDI